MTGDEKKPPPFFCPECGQKHRADISALIGVEGAVMKATCAGCGIALAVTLDEDDLPTCTALEEFAGAEPVDEPAEPEPPPAPVSSRARSRSKARGKDKGKDTDKAKSRAKDKAGKGDQGDASEKPDKAAKKDRSAAPVSSRKRSSKHKGKSADDPITDGGEGDALQDI